jgi:hypothetical protein
MISKLKDNQENLVEQILENIKISDERAIKKEVKRVKKIL